MGKGNVMSEELYKQSRYQLDPLVDVLVGESVGFLRDMGNFLPHAATYSIEGEIDFVGAAPENEITNSEEVLPLLHEGLRYKVGLGEIEAIAVAEHVKVAQDGGVLVDAIKIVFENNLGLCAALYAPYKKKFFGKIQVEPMFAIPAKPEVIECWPNQIEKR